MVRKKPAIVISVILFVIAVGFIFVSIFVPKIGNAESFNRENTFEHSATVESAAFRKDAFEIRIKENNQTLVIEKSFTEGKAELLNEINSGDAIIFWTYFTDLYDLPNVEKVGICALTVNNVPIITIEESNRKQTQSLTIVRVLAIVFSVVLLSVGVLLLVLAYRKPKDKIEQSSQT